MSFTSAFFRQLAMVVGLWLIKGLCVGFGIFVAWRFCHAL
jgi:hypothetical protein